MMTVEHKNTIADAAERTAAIDTSHSCIVQAPAGSGKTELLIQRMLALLGRVERPQQILAITFTNKAAAEMRKRLLDALRDALTEPEPELPHQVLTWRLAAAALRRHGDSILRNPAQLAIQTIDSFNAALVRKMPWLSRFGSIPQMADEADALYVRAVDQLCQLLEQGGQGSRQLEILLRHLDNQLSTVQDMLVDMLRRRDQWLRYLHSGQRTTQQQLQSALEALYEEKLSRLVDSFPALMREDLLQSLRFAAANLPDSDLAACRDWTDLPGSDYSCLAGWSMVGDWLLTSTGDLRKRLTKKEGFPAGKEFKAGKERMQTLLAELASHQQFVRSLDQIRKLPLQGYSDGQWQLLEALIDLLPLLIYQLWLVFRNAGEADFAEIALKANHALGGASDPSDLLLKIDHDLQHILIDEFQDTSRLQYELLETLTSGWTPGDGRTLFLVGDPMQSIYLFREAEVGLFLHSFKGAFGELSHPLIPLRLTCNFRSQQGIVDWVNAGFATMFPATTDETLGAVPLSHAVAVKPLLPGRACTVHPFCHRDDRKEALKVIDLIRQAQAEDPEQSIAILVRGRNHLQQILPLLHEERISYRARDIALLGERPAALDLVHLTKALLHRGDRLSWLAVLRAPWCGLTLHDLHLLVGAHKQRTIPSLLEDEGVISQLSCDGRARVERIFAVLKPALDRCGRYALRELVEGCWLAIGALACYDAAALADVELVFGLLERLDEGGTVANLDLIDQGLAQIFSNPEAAEGCRLEIMTIHKAKGLEFDTVIIPGLGRPVGRVHQPLLRWFEHPDHGLLIAPLPARGTKEKDPLYQLISDYEKQKQDLETSRLLYVATTRAVRRLHLLGHAQQNGDGVLVPAPGSLLEKLWPLVSDDYRQDDISETADKDQPISLALKRLPVGWCLPDVQAVDLPVVPLKGIASGHQSEDMVFSGWENPAFRHVGTVVHQQLELISRNGREFWERQNHEDGVTQTVSRLRQMGVPAEQLVGCADRVHQAVEQVLASTRGCWLLTSHLNQASEYPLTGVVNGQLIHAVIDRTFVADGVRWIVDYKSSSPRADESLADFIKREVARYQDQLRVYIDLFKGLQEGYPIRAALYFPLVDGWYELPE